MNQTKDEDPDGGVPINVVVLRGKVLRGPEERTLPSGAVICSFRISVPRRPSAMTRGSKVSSDWFDCTAWSVKARRSVSKWTPGDQVEVWGSVRRRHLAGGATSLVDVEVMEARRNGGRQSAGAETR